MVYLDRRGVLAAVLLAATAALTACGTPDDLKAQPAGAASGEPGVLTINTSPDQQRIRAEKDATIAAAVPAAIASKGKLVVGTTGSGVPPLSFRASDDKTVIGVETDVAQLVADVLGLELDIQATSWENLFLVVRSGQYDAGFSNITVTEERKDIYDFATYRVDTVAWEVPIDSKLTTITKPADIAGLTVSVGSGTNQEQILLGWDQQNKAAGLEPIEIQYYQNPADYYLALESGRIAAWLGPNPTSAYHAAVSGKTKIVGQIQGGGEIAAQIAAMTAKGNGLAQPVSDALNLVIKNGKYAEVLARWGLTNESIPASQVNPQGLPRKK
ncbi:ABC transporter substrate-binding protein [Catenuloplanes sp. NPDC051500]|uniref:ABC transporter substrate-binding protein n=1 Tax=Catenuloplanes sp. NPDC051500 TaxID=3363959 RepID=UPI0037A3634F